MISKTSGYSKITASTGLVSYDAILYLYAPSKDPSFQSGITLDADHGGVSIRPYRYGTLVWLNTESWLIGPLTSNAEGVQRGPYTAQEMEIVIFPKVSSHRSLRPAGLQVPCSVTQSRTATYYGHPGTI